MSVLLETSLGDLVIDLETQQCPKSCLNFLKLCKSFQYNYLTFFSVQKDFLAQTGDPTNTGQGGSSIWSQLDASSPDYSTSKYFTPERHRTMKHTKRGTISMACTAVGDEDEDEVIAGSQFFITLADNVEYLDRKHAPFGYVVEGDEKGGTLDKINSTFVDKERRPLRDIRIQHLVVLDDPFEDPQGLRVPSRTPSPTPEQLAAIGLDASTIVDDPSLERPAEEVEEAKRKADTTAAALTLEMVGDLPFAEVRPPENILFVCKLNPITRSEDLELIFSRFGKILSCEVIKDKKTGDSLQYAFIEFDEQKSAEQAYFKMQNVLIDDRRIWVDFSQSVSKLSTSWNTSRSGGKPLRVTAGASRDNRGADRDQHAGRERRRDRDLVFDFDSRAPRDKSSRSERSVEDRRCKSDRDDWRGASQNGESRDRGRYEETPSYRPKHYSEDRRDSRRHEAGSRYDDREDDRRDRQRDYGRKEDRPYRSDRERSPKRSRHVR